MSEPLKKESEWRDEGIGGLFGLHHLIWGLGAQRPFLETVNLISDLSVTTMVRNGESGAIMLVAKPIGTDKIVPIAKLSEVEQGYSDEEVLVRTIASLRSLADTLSSSLHESANNLERYAPIRRHIT